MKRKITVDSRLEHKVFSVGGKILSGVGSTFLEEGRNGKFGFF